MMRSGSSALMSRAPQNNTMQTLRSPVRVAQIGCNGVAHEHARAHRLTGNTVLAAVCDIDVRKGESFATQHSVPVFCSDFDQVLKRDDIDMVDIVTSDHTHADLVIRAAQAGKHALVEKPLALTALESARIIEEVEKSGTLAMCAQMMRWDAKYRTVVEQVHAGAVGRPTYVQIWGGCPRFWSGENWPEAASGGREDFLLFREGVHWMDLLTWLLGEYPDSLYTIGHPGDPDVPLWEYFSVNMRFPSGVLALGESNRVMKPGNFPFVETGMCVVGTEGTIALEPSRQAGAWIHQEKGFSLPGYHVDMHPMDDRFAGEIRHFADCILTGETPSVGLDHSRRVLVALESAARSFRSGNVEGACYE